MEAHSLAQIAHMSISQLAKGDGRLMIHNISSDTRKLLPGELYLALRGEHFDGHAFIQRAAELGAAGAWVGNEWTPAETGALPEGFALLRAPEPLDALGSYQRLAKAYRHKLMTPVIGVTGSNGKTSTKDLLACAFGASLVVHKTQGNLNNHIGVPRTLLQLTSVHDLAIVEMGMNNAGEIALLASLAEPQVGVITNIGVAHIGRLGSQEAIAREKGSLLEALPPDGLAVLPSGDEFTWFLQDLTSAEVITGGIGEGHVSAHNLRPVAGGTEFQVRRMSNPSQALRGFLPVPGEHMVANAMLALAAVEGFAPDMFPEALEALCHVELTSGRMEVKDAGGLRVLDDTYNANPDSMVAALRTLQRMCSLSPGAQSIAVLGAMGELGAYEGEGYERVAQAAGQCGVGTLVTVNIGHGPMEKAALEAGVEMFIPAQSHAEAAAVLKQLATPRDYILLKGSRTSRMEKVLELLQDQDSS
jgi:UDP-N-acetylmuramoyl-tripeptide--D-alanyl-D-alanine ligase